MPRVYILQSQNVKNNEHIRPSNENPMNNNNKDMDKDSHNKNENKNKWKTSMKSG